VTANQPNGLTFTYYLARDTSGPVTLSVADSNGAVVGTLEAGGKAGINRATWEVSEARRTPPDGFRAGRPGPKPLTPGEYVVTLTAGAAKATQRVRVLPDAIPGGASLPER
jgi:hypothetical protein